MKLKQIPEDFIVNEIYDLEKLKEKDESSNSKYYYFKLTKNNYNQFRALDIVAKTFNTSKKFIHFSGNKDKVGITSQLISIRNLKEFNLEKNLDFFNSNFKDLNLEYIGIFKSRLNLGDNVGNLFEITIRDLNDSVIENIKKNIVKFEHESMLNFFGNQRFGYANNSHIVGKYILQNNVESAVYTILTSRPENPSEDLLKFINFIEKNFKEIKEQNISVINEGISYTTNFLENERKILEHLKMHKNDFPGAFRRLHKKLRTIYVNAYQSYIFNELLKEFQEIKKIDNYKQIPLVSYDSILDDEIEVFVNKLLKKDNLSLNSFKLPSMPELKANSVMRDVKIDVDDLKIESIEDDDLNEGKKKMIISFKLYKGVYATNVIEQLVCS